MFEKLFGKLSKKSKQDAIMVEEELPQHRMQVGMEAQVHFMNGEYDRVVGIYKNNPPSRYKDWLLFAEAYAHAGQFENAYETYLKADQCYDADQSASNAIQMFEGCGFKDPDFPKPTNYQYPQNKERSDESYPESDYLKGIDFADEYEVEDILNELFSETTSGSNEEKAQAHYLIAEIYLRLGNGEGVYTNYVNAIKLNPNKALYWGYFGQLLNRSDMHPFICSRFCYNAIELDYNNPKWHLNQSLILGKLIEMDPTFIHQSMKEANLALDLVRSDQNSLRQAIVKYIDSLENMKRAIFQSN